MKEKKIRYKRFVEKVPDYCPVCGIAIKEEWQYYRQHKQEKKELLRTEIHILLKDYGQITDSVHKTFLNKPDEMILCKEHYEKVWRKFREDKTNPSFRDVIAQIRQSV